jgi:hypothetical protein
MRACKHGKARTARAIRMSTQALWSAGPFSPPEGERQGQKPPRRGCRLRWPTTGQRDAGWTPSRAHTPGDSGCHRFQVQSNPKLNPSSSQTSGPGSDQPNSSQPESSGGRVQPPTPNERAHLVAAEIVVTGPIAAHRPGLPAVWPAQHVHLRLARHGYKTLPYNHHALAPAGQNNLLINPRRPKKHFFNPRFRFCFCVSGTFLPVLGLGGPGIFFNYPHLGQNNGFPTRAYLNN